jgi:hypothetical protein
MLDGWAIPDSAQTVEFNHQGTKALRKHAFFLDDGGHLKWRQKFLISPPAFELL